MDIQGGMYMFMVHKTTYFSFKQHILLTEMAFKFLRGKKCKEKNSFIIHSVCFRPEYYMPGKCK